ncbi:chemotaxis protein CheW [Belnapia moabensis]|uniref:chemotaxis protein CheW n=1 Tax=Belnapia moabensis TaxID=365533 RepID=UPI0005BC671C|nr:chemotaxis protein CheW [Belnapia moabensis]
MPTNFASQAEPVASAAATVTVTVAGEALALPASAVREVLRPRPLTRVPQAPPALLGLAGLRGAALPVVSLAALTGRAVAPPSSAARILVLDGPSPVGLLVDSVAALGAGTAQAIDPASLLAAAFGAPVRRGGGPAAAARAMTADAAAETLALLGFSLAGQEFALPLDKVEAVMRLPAPGAALAGVTTYRGALLPLVSPHVLLGLPAAAQDRGGRVVVVRLGSSLVGLVVDRLRAIHRLTEAAIDPVPPVLARGRGEARLEAIGRLAGGGLVAILSPARLFDAETTARLLAEAAKGMEAMPDSSAAAEAAERFLVFRLGEEEYGLPVSAVEEVARRPAKLTRLPRAPTFVAGAMNLRGTVLPVIDQRHRFAAGGEAPTQGGRVIVVTTGGVRSGFAVDAVVGIVALPATALAPAPEIAGGGAVFDRVATVEREGRVILLIDPQALLDAAERDLVNALARTGGTAAP